MTASQKRLVKAFIDEHLKTERPNKHTDRVAWNAHFELDITLGYAGFSYENTPLMENETGHDWGEITDINLKIANRTRELMYAEGTLISLALENLRYGNFEKEWLGLRLQKKKDLALEGLYRGACSCPRDNSRVSCPELTIKGLVGDGEYNFISLLKRIVEHDPTGNRRVKEVFLFRHPHVEHQWRFTDTAPDVVKASLYLAQLYRTFCIVETLHGIIDAYHGVPMESTRSDLQTSMPARHGEKAEARQATARRVAEEDKNSVRPVDQSQCKEMAASTVAGCYGCYMKIDRKHLKRCGQCQDVWYCSPLQCQKKDWPEHKKACGKQTFSPLSLNPAAPDEFIGCPVAVPGFVRTPALWRQIWYLSKEDSQYSDYHFDTHYAHTSSIAVQYPPGARLIFLVARRRAMASGSLPAIFKMLEILEFEEDVGVRNFTHACYRRQFEKEYDIKITPETKQAAGEFAPPTTKELEEEEQFLRQRWASVANTHEPVFPCTF
ncbi:hypothetical protein MSAN_01217600 [Mycena sanguinolenta]|uniref:MYND-type domain-containing protein n=1 Tax=Mycena sanguinolenta TaxID=230812 RepID=A0A8H7D4S6_9AGAR|nr:hypothetical protein MSAN_01217600 [Mycena sanguinolenta]